MSDDLYDCTPYDCPRWQKILTVYGACCSFNYYPTPEAKLNATVLNQFGELGGLNILLSSQHLPDSGISLIISRPGGYIMHYSEKIALVPGFDNFFSFYVNKFSSHSNFASLDFESRRCMLPQEDDRWKSISWCTLSYTLEAIYKECGCHPYYMPNRTKESATKRKCTVKDLNCFRYTPGKYPICSILPYFRCNLFTALTLF